jgi:hypothetical protein
VYLARTPNRRKTHYYIRQSYCEHGSFKSRDLFYLGTDPRCYIIYPGGHGYYYDPCIEEALMQAGVPVDQNHLDDIFFEFLDPEIQRVIMAFDRSRHGETLRLNHCGLPPGNLHAFDKRRYFFLRFGKGSSQGRVENLPDKFFRPLLHKSRDEVEQYFLQEERLLRYAEKAVYVSAIFNMRRFRPDPENNQTILEQMDSWFVSCLCRLNDNRDFWADIASEKGLNEYLVRYAVMYFDYEPPRQSAWQSRFQEFVNQHRAYRPPRKIRVKLEEAAVMFGKPWKELKAMDRGSLARLYRRLSLKHHPDRGGSPDAFRKLTQYYQALLRRKP